MLAVKIVDALGMDIDRIIKSSCGRFKIQGASFEEVIKMVPEKTPVIGISIMFSQEWPFIRDFIRKLKQSRPEAIIVAGGEHVSALTEYSLRDCPEISYIVRGEGEAAFLELCQNILSGKSVLEIPGVAWLHDNEYRVSMGKRIIQVDELPWPAWDLMDLEPYFRPNFTMGISHGRNIPILATRGCPYQCTFCSSPAMWTTRYTMRTPSQVVDEIEFYVSKYSVKSIDFFDLTAIVQKKWILDFTSELKKRDVKVAWSLPSGTRSEALDEEVIKALKSSGMELLVYAPESGSPEVLKDIKKKVRLEKMMESIVLAKKHGLTVKLNLVIGFPTERRKDILKTMFMMWKLALHGVDDADLSIFSPYPGSELFRELVDKKEIPEINDKYFEDLIVMYDFTFFKNFCHHVWPFELTFYRVLAMSVFYIISYLWFPSRMWRVFSSVLGKKPFSPRSLFEQRIYDIVARYKLEQSLKGNS